VSLPKPQPGLVIRYAYLWKREYDQGRDEGSKDRPCAIVMTVLHEDDGEQVLVLPITHAPPRDAADAVEIPPATKKRLGLDGERSWIMINEVNEFTWPGPDIRPVHGKDDASIVYGLLPKRLFEIVREQFLRRLTQDQAVRVPRTE
jgi:mRNA-degrading endonuclease toxin of MazEF toxin-antitoxin module